MEQSQSKSRIPELDGIRGIAILSVICYHYISMEGVTPAGSITDRLQRLVILGGTGVDLFFVLSGFLIGGTLLDVFVIAKISWRIFEEPLLKRGYAFRY